VLKQLLKDFASDGINALMHLALNSDFSSLPPWLVLARLGGFGRRRLVFARPVCRD